jgi:hypothetical protein
MSVETEPKKKRGLKICRVDTKGKIMDVSDPDPIPVVFNPDDDGSRTPKLAFNYTHYNLETNKSECQHTHWVDVDTMRLLAWDLQNTKKGDKGEKGYTAILDEFKGGPAMAAGITELGDNGIISRRMTISYNDGLNMGPVYQFNFVVCEGRKGDKGQIMPVKGSKEFVKEQINVPVAAARKLGCRIYAYLIAKETAAEVTNSWVK